MRRVPWIALGPLGALAFGWLGAGLVRHGLLSLPACPLKALTGLPCATCGLSRCVLALAQGEFRAAFHWHPVAVVLLGLSPLAASWDLWRAWRGQAYPALPDSLVARLAVAGLLLGTWILQVVRHI